MFDKQWHTLKKEGVLRDFGSSLTGISEKEASKRLKEYGDNVIQETLKLHPLKIFLSQFKSIFIYILLVATIFSLIIKHYIDSSIIFIIIMFNVSVGFFQQYKAEKSILELKKILIPTVRVMREGRLRKISSKEIIPGDLLILSEGDRVVADCRLIVVENLEVNEAILTGESVPVVKTEEIFPENTLLAERANMLYAGTSIVAGNCKALVVATGMKTEFGRIAGMLQDIKFEETLMQKKLNKFAKQISIMTFFLALVLAVIGMAFGVDKFQMLLTSVVLLVSSIPEGLPAVITISLAFASVRMSKNNVILRRLSAAESLGSITIICSDKTGPMTEERMEVKRIFSGGKVYDKEEGDIFLENKKINFEANKGLIQLLNTSVLASNARFEKTEKKNGTIKEIYEIIGEPTESALVLASLEVGVSRKVLSEKEPRLKEFSFTSNRKMMSILRGTNKKKILYSKGASPVIIDKCSYELISGKIEKLSTRRKKQLIEISENMESQALRVLAFAYKDASREKIPNEGNLIFTGFMGMLDSPRKEVKGAIEICKRAGIKVKMITGDSAITAREIAKQVGIFGKIITGQELDRVKDEQLRKEINEIGIFARITPEQKLRIVKILKSNGENVAITGDGVNDSLALKTADVGIAMGIRGSDVAREVSDIVLIDDNFASIVQAVKEGRIVYDNTKKVTKFLLSVNFSEMLLVAFAVIGKYPLPLLPLQILWMNLVTDSIPAVAFVKEKGENVMERKPLKETSILDNIFVFVLIAG